MTETLRLEAQTALRGPRTARLSISEAAFHFRRLGMSLRATGYGSEFRINFRYGPEATAAYEDSLSDAIDTGLAMLAHKTRMEAQAIACGIPADIAARDAFQIVTGA